MDVQFILSFLVTSILLTLMPGPDILLVLTESITKGKRNGIALSTGLSSGVIVHTLLAATGLSILLKNSEYTFNIIKIFGALYMLYLSFQTITEKPEITGISKKIKDRYSFWSIARKGFFMNVLNPKVTLFFVAFLPQFISNNGFSPTKQMLLLGLIFMLQAFVVFSTISVLAGRLNNYLIKPKFWLFAKWIKATVLTTLGLFLLLT